IFDSYNNATLAVLKKYGNDHGRVEAMSNGHRNMLKNAVLSFYQAGLRDKAQKILNELRDRYGQVENFQVPLDEFARQRLIQELDSIGIQDATEQVVLLLINGYRLYALREDNAAAANERFAQQVWDYYFKEFGDTARVDLPPMAVLRYHAIGQFLSSDAYPVYIRQGLLARIQIEKPELLKQLEQTEAQLRKEIEQLQKTQTP
ncbi:MAG: hypothetical protein ACM3VT_00350, partial [Solirubrobacterales bacterium]